MKALRSALRERRLKEFEERYIEGREQGD